jgi:F420-dependent oxidoreductase-like protein
VWNPRIRIGLHVSSYTGPDGPAALGPRLAEVARSAEDAGFASFWVSDHFFQTNEEGGSHLEMLEGWSVLAFAAALTQRMSLGTLVSGVTYRNPGVLVKTSTTLDVLSGGRAWLGIGAAWYKREHTGLGLPRPPVDERLDRLEETLRVAQQMWSDDDGRFEGRFTTMKRTVCVPQPVAKPHPPILVGGGGERRTLHLVARYGDACNLFEDLGPDGLRHKLDLLRRHCDAEQRDYDTIERTSLGVVELGPSAASAGDVVRRCRDLAGAGIQHAIFIVRNLGPAPLEVFGKEIIPEVAGF